MHAHAPQLQENQAASHHPLPPLLRRFWVDSIGACVLMFVIAAIDAHRGMPRTSYHPLADPAFSDLLEYIPTLRMAHTPAFWANAHTVAYPPFSSILLAALYAIAPSPVATYLVIAALWLAAGAWGVRRTLLRHGIAPWPATLFPVTIALVSFPIEGMLQRGNIELFLWIFAALGTWAWLRRRDNAAAILWSLAAAMKLYPVVLLILLIPRKSYRSLALGVGCFTVLTFASLLYLGPTLPMAWHGCLHNVFGYQSLRVSTWSFHEQAEDHSVFGIVKMAAIAMGHASADLTPAYYLCGGVLFAIVFFARLRTMPLANQLLAVSVFMVMLPPVSYYYTLAHLYAPWLVLVFLAVRSAQADLAIPGLYATVMLFLPLFACYTLLTYPTFLLYGGPLQAVCLLALFGCALRFPFASPSAPAAARAGRRNAQPA